MGCFASSNMLREEEAAVPLPTSLQALEVEEAHSNMERRRRLQTDPRR